MTLEQLITKLDAVTEWQKRAYRQYRWVKWEYRIIIVLLALCGIINALIAWRIR